MRRNLYAGITAHQGQNRSNLGDRVPRDRRAGSARISSRGLVHACVADHTPRTACREWVVCTLPTEASL